MVQTDTPDTDTGRKNGSGQDAPEGLPVGELKKAGQELLQALVVKVLGSASGKMQGMTQRLTDVAEKSDSAGVKAAAAGAEKLAEGESPLKAGLKAGTTGAKETIKGAVGSKGEGAKGSKGAKGGEAKGINIIEEFDVGLPLRVVYDQWTQFADYPSFTKKVESVEQESDEKINWRAKIFLSHRDWESTIIEQVPDKRIVWMSKGAKGYVDGAVTFHELAPTMTRVLLVAEYYPSGFFEKTANLWRAQGRRLRLEYKNIKRHMMTQTILEQDEVEGWRGEIRDGEVVKTHEEVLKEEQDKGEDKEKETTAEAPEDENGPEPEKESDNREDT
ncbi:SRPBCC family protein [Actinomadura macra]|uniref:SRPBCC family protein n=1 Tax=Actinomadura macra TaxID=46164 RepID=UPI000832B1EA|nr:SRPBCC family protein [Actinomadura macra]